MENSIKIMINGETVFEIPEPKKKSLYREFLGKQLGILEAAQEDAQSNGEFKAALEYSQKILEMSKEIDQLDNGKLVDQSVDKFTTHQPETKLDLVKLIQFAMEGVELSKLRLKASDHARWTCQATREKELNDYKDELEREYSRLTNG